MIYLITKANKTYTFLSFLNTWGNQLRQHTTFIPLEKLVRQKHLHTGTYVLTDYDILTKNQSEILCFLYNKIQDNKSLNLINNPNKSLDRLNFLNTLYEKGHNKFRCFGANQLPPEIIFPVFIRKGRGHDGKITDLITNLNDLQKKIKEIKKEGFEKNEILITEFVDTKDKNGIFRKYSAFRVGNEIIARHIFFSKKWMIKGADYINQDVLKEELSFLKNNPHKKQIEAIFELAEMQYGRIDYSISNEMMVTWEINSNPMIASSSSLKKQKRKELHDYFAASFVEAFKKINKLSEGEKIANPLLEKYSINELKTAFPYSSLLYQLSLLFHNFKSIALFWFYKLRNRLI